MKIFPRDLQHRVSWAKNAGHKNWTQTICEIK